MNIVKSPAGDLYTETISIFCSTRCIAVASKSISDVKVEISINLNGTLCLQNIATPIFKIMGDYKLSI